MENSTSVFRWAARCLRSAFDRELVWCLGFTYPPPHEAHLSKLGLRKSLRGASSAAETAICGWGSHFEKSEFPSSHRREEGWRRHQEKSAKPPYGRRRGGCSLSQRSEHHPVLAKSGCYAILS